jgi:DNA-directed RNA polymerase subunit RPC12/RpoP
MSNTAAANALDVRWDGLLSKIRERFDELMRESVVGCAALLVQTGGDPTPVSNAWQGMRMRALALRSKVSDSWSDQVQDKYHDIEAYDRADAAWARAEVLLDDLEIELEQIETKIFADAIRSLLQMAAVEQAQLRCSQCGAQLEHAVTLQSIDVSCRHCGALVSLEPGPRARMAEAMSHHLWREACWQQWLTRHRAEDAVRRARTATLAQLQAWEQAEIEYLTAYLGERAKLMPHTAGELDKELRGRLHMFYQSLDNELVWKQAGSPRRIK